MTSPLDILVSVTMNMLVFGGIIYGLLARSKGNRLAVRLAVVIPLTANLAGLAFKPQFTLEERVLGVATTLALAGLLYAIAKRRGLLSPSPPQTDH